MGRARLVSRGAGLVNRYVSTNAGFYDRVAFEKMERSTGDMPITSTLPNGRTAKKVKPKKSLSKSKKKAGHLPCPDCGRMFGSSVAIAQHQNAVHRNGTSKSATVAMPPKKGLGKEQTPANFDPLSAALSAKAEARLRKLRSLGITIRVIALASQKAIDEINENATGEWTEADLEALIVAKKECAHLQEVASTLSEGFFQHGLTQAIVTKTKG